MEGFYLDVGMKAGKYYNVKKSAVFVLNLFLIYFRFTVCNLHVITYNVLPGSLGTHGAHSILCTLYCVAICKQFLIYKYDQLRHVYRQIRIDMGQELFGRNIAVCMTHIHIVSITFEIGNTIQLQLEGRGVLWLSPFQLLLDV